MKIYKNPSCGNFMLVFYLTQALYIYILPNLMESTLKTYGWENSAQAKLPTNVPKMLHLANNGTECKQLLEYQNHLFHTKRGQNSNLYS